MTVELVALLVGGVLIILAVTALLIVLLARDPSVLRGLLTRRGHNQDGTPRGPRRNPHPLRFNRASHFEVLRSLFPRAHLFVIAPGCV
jgi:hypothetical protein